MDTTTVVWSMIAAACLTLAALHLPVWWRNRDARASLAFAVAASCTAAIAYFELHMLKAQTTSDFVAAMKWRLVPVDLLLISLVAFAYHYFNTGLLWLGMSALGVRLISTVLNFTTGVNLNYLEVTDLVSVSLLGDTVAAPLGVPNPSMAVGQLAVVLLAFFFAVTAAKAWRRGRRVAAVLVGGSITFLMIASVTQAIVVFWQLVPPAASTVSLFSLGVVMVMGYALSVDMLRAAHLVRELQHRKNEADLAAEAADLGIWTRDVGTDALWTSSKWRELFGFTALEPLSTQQMLERIHGDDRSTFDERITQAAREMGAYQTEFRLMLPDGRTRWIAAMGQVQHDAKRRPIRIWGACIDITSRKSAEQEMLRLRQDIAHVGRVSLMGQLSSALAHEISQPLGAILRNAEAGVLFLQDTSPDLTEIGVILNDILSDDQRASAVIERMRALLRRQEIAMTSLQIDQMLGDVTALLRPDAAARHVAIELHVPDDLPHAQGDRVQIQQVLLNLIVNGMDAIEALHDQRRAIAVTARKQMARIEISVTDNGPGIAAAGLERVFEPFFTTKTKGLGMGLSISRGIVEAHGGRLWAENNVGGGATFRFTLPVAA